MAAYEVLPIEGKGNGLIAVKDIPRGSLILVDRPMMQVNTSTPTHQDIEAAFSRLNKNDRESYTSLYEGRSSFIHETKVVRIFNSNHFGNENSKFVLPLIARMNHSCVPNATIVDNGVFAQKNITAGEEIQICYKESWDEVLTASQRNLLFKYRYGFTCSCAACVPVKDCTVSDQIRLLIGAVRFALEGQQPANFKDLIGFKPNESSESVLRKAHWPPKAPSTMPVRTSSQRIEYTILLAKLREAEGLGSVPISRTFVDAAGILLDLQFNYASRKLVPGRRMMFVEAARCCVAWMEKAVEHASYGGGKDSEMFKLGLRNMQTGSSIVAVTLALAGDDMSGGDQQKKCYTLSVDIAGNTLPRQLNMAQSEELLGCQT